MEGIKVQWHSGTAEQRHRGTGAQRIFYLIFLPENLFFNKGITTFVEINYKIVEYNVSDQC